MLSDEDMSAFPRQIGRQSSFAVKRVSYLGGVAIQSSARPCGGLTFGHALQPRFTRMGDCTICHGRWMKSALWRGKGSQSPNAANGHQRDGLVATVDLERPSSRPTGAVIKDVN